MIDSPETTVKQIKDLFTGIKDYGRETKLLSNILDQERCKYLEEILMYVQDNKPIKRICNGTIVCINTFNLRSEITDIVRVGCSLSENPQAKSFHNVNKVVGEYLNLDQDETVVNILMQLEGLEELLKFTIAIKNYSGVRFMKEAAANQKENTLSTQVIFDFGSFWSFFSDLKTSTYAKTLEKFFIKMKDLGKNKVYAGIISDIQSSKKNFDKIQTFYDELLYEGKSKKKQILAILKSSCCKFLQNQDEFDVEVKCTLNDPSEERCLVLNKTEISKLRDRASLVIYDSQAKEDTEKDDSSWHEEDLTRFKDFCSLVDIIDQVVCLLAKLQSDGYPELMNLMVASSETSIAKTQFICSSNQMDSLYNFKMQLEAVLTSWYEAKIDAYTNYYELTYLKDEEFWTVEKALTYLDESETKEGKHLLGYMGKRIVHSILDITLPAVERLKNLGRILRSLPTISEIERYRRPLDHLPSLFVMKATVNNILQTVLTVYITYEGVLPGAFQLLTCHASTSWSELVAFAYRCLFNPEHKLFCLIYPEMLSFSLHDQFLTLIRSLEFQYPEQRFNLTLLTTDTSAHLVSSLKGYKETKILEQLELINIETIKESVQKNSLRCTAVCSRIAGLGKSTYIRNFAKAENTPLFKIPITSSIDLIDIGKRLLSLPTLEKCALWLSIGSIKPEEKPLLNELLFNLIVLKALNSSRKCVTLSPDIYIFLELESSYFESLCDIEILKYLQKVEINDLDFNKINYWTPKTQFICYCLEAFAEDSIGRHNLVEGDVQGLIIPTERCLKVLVPAFLQYRDLKYASYTELNVYINILYYLLKGFSESPIFRFKTSTRRITQQLDKDFLLETDVIARARTTLFDALLVAVDPFISGSIENMLSERNRSIDSHIIGSELLGNVIASWESKNQFTIVFPTDQYPIFVYKSLNDVPDSLKESIQHHSELLKLRSKEILQDYENYSQIDLFEKLVGLNDHFLDRNICLRCLTKHDKIENICLICSEILLTHNSKDYVKKVGEESEKEFALTPDNFIKIIMIYLRVQQKIPVVILGQPGCGKASLIRYLCTRILDDEFQAFFIHSGTDRITIIQEMKKYIDQAKKLEEKRLWVYFDEFNTTDNIGLMKEIICERTMLGRSLPDNMVLLGACSPWTLNFQSTLLGRNYQDQKAIPVSKDYKYSLLHKEHPLPETMIQYLWDFGSLGIRTERRYISVILSGLNREDDNDFMDTVINLVLAVHCQLRQWTEVTPVSLRDVARCGSIYYWLLESLIVRDKLQNKGQEKPVDKLHQQAAILAILICYYLKLSSTKRRTELLMSVEPWLARFDMTNETVEDLLIKQEMDFIDRMKPLSEGIAGNRTLRENVFVLIVCICAKVPIVISGNPGSSRSLAMKLIIHHLKGKNSRDRYFRTLPEIVAVSHQTSELSTPASLLEDFNKAERYLTVKRTKTKILPVILLDQLNQAKTSVDSFLKTIYNSIGTESLNVGFVVIPSGFFDASQVNRALCIAGIEPSISDLKDTVAKIYKDLILCVKMVDPLAESFYSLREKLKEGIDDERFRLKDFYALVKGIRTDLFRLHEIDFSIVRRHFKRNFSGYNDAYKFLWSNFCLKLGINEHDIPAQEDSILELITSNLLDKDSRFLMLITQSEYVTEYIENFVGRESNRKIKTFVGCYAADHSKDQLDEPRVINDILLHAEHGYTLILKEMRHAYSSLYSLFTQDFLTIEDRRYCRISSDSSPSSKSYIHNDFRCIVFVNDGEVASLDPSFLSLFERYKLHIEDVLTYEESTLYMTLVNWIRSITVSRFNHKRVRPELIFTNYSDEYLYSLILKVKSDLESSGGKYTDEQVINACKTKLIKTAAFDFSISVLLNVDDQETRKALLDEYYGIKAECFQDFCAKSISNNEEVLKSVVYTYTKFSENLEYPNKDLFRELKLTDLKSETEIVDVLKHYFDSNDRLLVIRLELMNLNKFVMSLKNLIKSCLDRFRCPKGHHIMIIMHLQRFNAGAVSANTLFYDWESITFDDLNNGFIPERKLIDDPTFHGIRSLRPPMPLKDLIQNLFLKCLTRIKYNVPIEDENKLNARRNRILAAIQQAEGQGLLELVVKKINDMISLGKANVRSLDWRETVLFNERIQAIAYSSYEAVDLALENYYEAIVMNIVYTLEKDWILDAYLDAASTKEERLVSLWQECFERMDVDVNKIVNNKYLEIDFSFRFQFPFSTYEGKLIQDVQDAANPSKDLSCDDYDRLSELKERSIYGVSFYTNILEREDRRLFDTFFHDQCHLYFIRNRLSIRTDILTFLLNRLHMGHQINKLNYFLKNSRELWGVLRVIEVLLTMKDGENILYKILSGFYTLNEVNIDTIDIESDDLPKHLLFYKDDTYYQIPSHWLPGLQESQGDLEVLEPSKDESPFLSFLFRNIVEEISSSNYLAKSEAIMQTRSALSLINDRILETKVLLPNIGDLRPWIDLIRFIGTYDKNPDTRFQSLLADFNGAQTEEMFYSVESIKKLMGYVSTKSELLDTVDQPQRERKLIKLQAQFYIDFVYSNGDEFPIEVIYAIDKDPNLWRSSAKIVSLFDQYIGFSSSIIKSNGRIGALSKDSKLLMLEEKVLKRTSEKIALLLVNKAFLTIRLKWHNNGKEYLDKYYDVFTINLAYFKKLSKILNNTGKDTIRSVSFLGVIAWLRVYIHFYSVALESSDQNMPVLNYIHKSLLGESPEVSTLQLFALKNLKHQTGRFLPDIREQYKNIDWISLMLEEAPNPKEINLVPFLPLDDEAYLANVDSLLHDLYNVSHGNIEKFINLCKEAKNNYTQLLCIYSWFIRFYMNYAEFSVRVQVQFIKLLQRYKAQLIPHLGSIGFDFIILLLSNFPPSSFLHLKRQMNPDEIYQRLIIVSIMASFMAQRALDSSLSTLLFENQNFPKDFVLHLSRQCLFGQIESRKLLTNMHKIKEDVQRRLQQTKSTANTEFIYKCSSQCDYLYYFEDFGKPCSKSICKECGSEIGAGSYNNLLRSNDNLKQIAISLPDGLKHIEEFLQSFKGQDIQGYLLCEEEEEEVGASKLDLKPITYRTLRLFLHATIYGLYEAKFISPKDTNDIVAETKIMTGVRYFRDHFQQDFRIIRELLGSTEPHIWIYQLLPSIGVLADQKGPLRDSKGLYTLEKRFEELVINPLIESPASVIQDYQRKYLGYNKYLNEEDISVYVDELRENDVQYPFLKYFGFLKIPTFEDIIDDFLLKMSSSETTPLLDLVLRRHKELSNLSLLPRVVDFTNLLLRKFNHQISIDEANSKRLFEVLKDDNLLQSKFAELEADWNTSTIQAIPTRFGEKQLEKISSKESLSFFLPSLQNDGDRARVAELTVHLASLHNEFVHIVNRANRPSESLGDIIQMERNTMDPIQTIEPYQVVDTSKDRIFSDFINTGSIHSYAYGLGGEVHYDFEEIESKLNQYANGLKILDEKKLSLMEYQSEFYQESSSFITHVRSNNPQESFTEDERSIYKHLLTQSSNKNLFAFLDLLNYSFAYLQNKNEDVHRSALNFCQSEMMCYEGLDNNILNKPPFSRIPVKHVVSLYETLEEAIFDKIIKGQMQIENIQNIKEDEALPIVELFRQAIHKEDNVLIYSKCEGYRILGRMFKRLIFRTLGTKINKESRLGDYFTREDVWETRTDIKEISKVILNSRIKLKHAFVILEYVESQRIRLERDRFL